MNLRHIPHLEIKLGGYFRQELRLSDFTLSITRISPFQKAGKEPGTVVRHASFSPGGHEVELPVKAISTSLQFRQFCLCHGNYNWMGSDRDLQHLVMDLHAENEKRLTPGESDGITAPPADSPETE